MMRAAVIGLVLAALIQAPAFRVGVDAVRVDVLVMDGSRPVAGLAADDFELRDSGVIQKITAATIGDMPISMLLALDTSGSVQGAPLTRLKEAARAAVATLAPGDSGALITFASAVTRQADWGASGADIGTAIDRLSAGGSTSLFDAAFSALTYRDAATGKRALIILFSDGRDTSSWLPSHAALDKARRTDAVVYVVAVGPPGREVSLQYRSGITLRRGQPRGVFEASPFVEDLAEATGGGLLISRDDRGLRDTFTRIVTDFRSRYVLTYMPEGVPAGGWHPISVRLKKARGKVTARRGYDR